MSISVGEIVVVLLVALLVIKPEKLPDVAFKCGQLLKWLRQTKAKLQQEIETPLEKVVNDSLKLESKPEKE